MNAKQYKAYQAAVEHNLKGLEFVSTGARPGCYDCGLAHDECKLCGGTEAQCPQCLGTGREKHSDHAIELASEPHFSWSECDACGSTLGGDRHPAHGRDKEDRILHFSVCSDCLYYLNYGQLDDMSMLEIEGS